MIDISVQNIHKEFEVGKKLLDGISFQIDAGQRVALLGPNGCGKTTLLRILTGEVSSDEGEIILAPNKRIGLISQIPNFPAHYTVEDVLESAFLPLKKIQQEMSEIEKDMENGNCDQGRLKRYDTLRVRFETGGGYDTQVQKNKISNGLSIPPAMREQTFSSLSGGEKTRANLARLLLEDTEILLLDEPTNHLDLRATLWLEEYLTQFRGTILIVSHDRFFLDKVVNRVIEIEHSKAQFYTGNYTAYIIEKQLRYETQLRQYEKEQAKVAQLEATARLLHERGTERMHKQAFSMEKRMERIAQTEKPTGRMRTMKARFSEKEFRADEVLTIKNMEKSFGDRMLFQNVNLEVTGGERIALLGDNGAGKTTLLKILLGEETLPAGKIHFGPTVKVGYLPQHVHFSHPERSLVDTLIYDLNLSAQSARDRLGAFHFRGDDVKKPVSALSGGEQSRLRLCMLMSGQINLLVLDEPTNHLDIQSREWIESAVDDFEGTLIFVSHDRYFIDRFAQRVWQIENGSVTDFKGAYEEFTLARSRAMSPPAQSAAQVIPEKKEKPKRAGGTKILEKQTLAAERAVAKAEEDLYDLTQEIEAASSDFLKLQELYQKREQLDEEILKLYATWESLAAQLEEARG